MKTKLYEIQVKDDGKYDAIRINGQDSFFTRHEAEVELQAYRTRFPHKIIARIREIK
jgi:hypothetical protein